MQGDQRQAPPAENHLDATPMKSTILEPGEFCSLLLSRRRFERCDTVGEGVHRLVDPVTREKFEVPEDLLQVHVMRLVES
jgi:hypothetical protein